MKLRKKKSEVNNPLDKKKNKVNKPQKENQFIDKVMVVMGKVGQQRHLGSIRDGFSTITPLIIAGALSMLFVTALFGQEGGTKTSLLGLLASWSGGIHVVTQADVAANPDLVLNDWEFTGRWATLSMILANPFLVINGATLGMMGLFFTFMLGYYLSKTRDFDDPITAGMVALASFMIVTQADPSFFGTAGSFIGIAIGIMSVELYVRICKIKKLQIRMPEAVPPAVGRAFSKLIPIILVLVIISTADTVLVWLPAFINDWGYSSSVGDFGFKDTDSSQIHFGQIIYFAVIAPFLGFAKDTSGGLAIGILFTILVTFIWFFGLHGDNILDGVFGTIFLTLTIQNTEKAGAIKKDYHLASIVNNGTLYSYVIIGGTGAVAALVIATMIFSRDKGQKTVAKYALGGTVFEISEPIVFGFPIVLNAVFLVPFIIVQPTLLVVAWMALKTHMVNPSVYLIPWTTPPILAGLLTSGLDWKSVVLSLVNLGIATAIYTPFVLLNNRMYSKNEKALADKKATEKKKIVIKKEEKAPKQTQVAA